MLTVFTSTPFSNNRQANECCVEWSPNTFSSSIPAYEAIFRNIRSRYPGVRGVPFFEVRTYSFCPVTEYKSCRAANAFWFIGIVRSLAAVFADSCEITVQRFSPAPVLPLTITRVLFIAIVRFSKETSVHLRPSISAALSPVLTPERLHCPICRFFFGRPIYRLYSKP